MYATPSMDTSSFQESGSRSGESLAVVKLNWSAVTAVGKENKSSPEAVEYHFVWTFPSITLAGDSLPGELPPGLVRVTVDKSS